MEVKNVPQIGFHEPSNRAIVMVYENGKWSVPRLVELNKFSLSPRMHALPYGQCIFEGMRVHRLYGGGIGVYRFDDYAIRFNRGLRAVGIPEVSPEFFFGGICMQFQGELRDSLIRGEYPAYYLRPYAFNASESLLPSAKDKFMFIMTASPLVNADGRTMRVLVEEDYARSAPGGLGSVKFSGNYASSSVVDEKASKRGFGNVLWLEKSSGAIQEFSTMNIFFVIDFTKRGTLWTPACNSNNPFLAGITRDSILKIADSMGILTDICSPFMHISKLIQLIDDGQVLEVFGTGTASMIVPCTEISYQGVSYFPWGANKNSMSSILKKQLNKAYTEEIFPEWTKFIPNNSII